MNSKVEIVVGELRATFLGKRGSGLGARGSWVRVKGATRPGSGNDSMAEPSAGLAKPSTNASYLWDEVVCCSRHGLRWDR